MYAKYSLENSGLKSYHHFSLDAEFRSDCKMWLEFLRIPHLLTVCRPFVDLSEILDADQLEFYTDSSASVDIGGCGGIFGSEWFSQKWENGFISKYNPGIQYLELYAVLLGVFIWMNKLHNSRCIVFCDNKNVVRALNKTSSKCKNCMYLVKILTLHCLKYNMRIFGKYIETDKNMQADHTSRLRIKKFREITPWAEEHPQPLPSCLWPLTELWTKPSFDRFK